MGNERSFSRVVASVVPDPQTTFLQEQQYDQDQQGHQGEGAAGPDGDPHPLPDRVLNFRNDNQGSTAKIPGRNSEVHIER